MSGNETTRAHAQAGDMRWIGRLKTVPFSRVMSSNSATGKPDRKVAIVTASTDGSVL